MKTLIIILITLSIYSAISTAAYIITKENDDIIIFFGLGIVGWLTMGVCWIIRNIRHWNEYHDKRSIIEIKETGECRWCYPKDTDDIYAWHEGYKLIERYASKEKWHQLHPFNSDFITKCKRNCDQCLCNGKECQPDGKALCKDLNNFENFKS